MNANNHHGMLDCRIHGRATSWTHSPHPWRGLLYVESSASVLAHTPQKLLFFFCRIERFTRNTNINYHHGVLDRRMSRAQWACWLTQPRYCYCTSVESNGSLAIRMLTITKSVIVSTMNANNHQANNHQSPRVLHRRIHRRATPRTHSPHPRRGPSRVGSFIPEIVVVIL